MEAVSGSKTEKYINSILEELGFVNERPTTLYCDNGVDTIIDRFKRLTDKYKHIDIQNFVLK